MPKPRLGVVLTDFGIPSEVWALRQAAAFRDLEPVFLAETHSAGNLPVPNGYELHLFGRDGAVSPWRRIQRKMGLWQGALPSPGTMERLRGVLDGAHLDAVLCHFAWNAIAVQEAAGDHVPVICHVHGRDVSANLRWPHYRQALAHSLPRFADVIAVGSHQIEVMRGLGFTGHSSIIPCGAPTGWLSSLPFPERAEGAPLVFITVGRVSPEKGQLQTLAAFEGVAGELRDAQLVIVGDGPAMPELRARIARSPVADRVRLTGMLAAEDVAAELAGAHVFLQHSRTAGDWVEGFGVTLVEAGAVGLPLIATQQGGIPDQVTDGENGFLIEADDVAAQARLMLKFAHDEALRRRMGQAARARAMEYDSDRMAGKLEARIKDVVLSRGNVS